MKAKLKIPIARLGAWHHPQYGVVKFTQADFESLEKNFRDNVRGYEPYLRYGHSVKGPGLHDGEPAIAHMVDVYQLSDVLWGVFEPNTDEVVDEIKRGAYRYATAEIIRNAKDKKTGKALGPFLKGHALTNTPFVPNLPRNVVEESATLAEVLSDEGEVEYVLSDLMEIPAHMTTCTNCGEERDCYNEAGLCETCETAVQNALEPRQKPELTMMQKLLQKFEQVIGRIEMLPWEIMDRMSRPEVAQMYSEATNKAAEESEQSDEETTTEQEVNETPADESTPEEQDADAPETPAEETVKVPETDLSTTSEDQEPAASPAPETTEENVDMEELEKLKAEMAQIQAEKAELEKAKAAAEAATLDAQKAAADAIAELDAQAAAAVAAETERKEQEFAVMLSDRITAVVATGVAPVKANKAADLVKALRASNDTIMLSEGSEPVNVMDAVFELLSDVQDVSFDQEGAVAGAPSGEDNPYQETINRFRAKRAGK